MISRVPRLVRDGDHRTFHSSSFPGICRVLAGVEGWAGSPLNACAQGRAEDYFWGLLPGFVEEQRPREEGEMKGRCPIRALGSDSKNDNTCCSRYHL